MNPVLSLAAALALGLASCQTAKSGHSADGLPSSGSSQQTGRIVIPGPFTRTSTGYDWRAVTLEYRKQYCDAMAAAAQNRTPGITGKFIFDDLQELYSNDDKDLLNTEILTAVAASVFLYGRRD